MGRKNIIPGRNLTNTERTKRWKLKNPHKVRDMMLIRKYGISLDQWENMFSNQDNKCAICLSEESGGRNWHTDHNHDTGKVRGVLCDNCNRGLGAFKDNIDNLSRAIKYLRITF